MPSEKQSLPLKQCTERTNTETCKRTETKENVSSYIVVRNLIQQKSTIRTYNKV